MPQVQWVNTTDDIFAFQRSLVGLGQDGQMPPESFAMESMLYDNDLGFFGGL